MKTLLFFVRKHFSEISFLTVLLSVYLVNAFIGEFSDEWDNILTGKMMADGLTLYRDIFSHHFPLPYIVSYIIHLLIDPNFYSFRILFSLFLFAWAAFLYWYSRAFSSVFPRKYFFLLIAFLSPALGMNMLLAEVLIGYSALSIVCIALYRPRPHSQRDLALLLFFAFLIAVSGMAYIPLALFTYLFVLVCILRNRSLYPWKRTLFLAAIALLPYALTVSTLIVTKSLDDFLWQNFTFNRDYYLGFLYDYPQGIFALPLFTIKNLSKAMVSSLNISLANVENIIYLALLLMTIAYLLHLLRQRSYWFFFLFLGVFTLSSARLATDTGIAHQGNVPFYIISLVSFTMISSKLFFVFRHTFDEFSKDWTMAIGTIIIFLFFAFTSLKVIDSYYSLTFTERRVQNGTPAATFLNQALKPGETYWIGPYDFKTQYYIHAPVATRYTFYLPWHAKSEEIQTEIIQDFQKLQPRIILFNETFSIWNHEVSAYGSEIISYIHQHYSPLTKDESGATIYRRLPEGQL